MYKRQIKWLPLNKKELSIVSLPFFIIKSPLTNKPYYRHKYIDLIKISDDYYYITLFIINNNEFQYYKLDQISELKEFFFFIKKQLNND